MAPRKTKTITESRIDTRPEISSPEWTTYVMQQFTKDELINDKPICDGLRRVFELLIGEIVQADAKVIEAPTNNNGQNATVEFRLAYIPQGYEFNSESPVKTITECFNVNKDNTPHPWNMASVATATTKAEARALRKGLRLLKVLSSEEISQGILIDSNDTYGSLDGEVDDKPITEAQQKAVRVLANGLNIDISSLLQSIDLTPDLGSLKYADGMKVLNTLNKYQRGPNNGGSDIPDEIKLVRDLSKDGMNV